MGYYNYTYYDLSTLSPSGAFANLTEALGASLAADPGLSAAATGGIHGDAADRDSDPPYVVIEQSVLDVVNLAKRGYLITHYLITISGIAVGRQAAYDLRALFTTLIMGTSSVPRTKLVFTDGLDTSRILTGGETLALDPDRGPENTDVWRASLPITWTVSRGGS